MDYFFRINNNISSEVKIKRSKFITHLKYVESIDSAKDFISEISAKYKTANHNCWAFVIGKKAETIHSSDNGEPSGTAGKPMLNMLQKNNLTNIVAVVTRYFGGVKLGIRGLIDAYSLCIEDCLTHTNLEKIVEKKYYNVATDYSFNEILKYQITQFSAQVESIDYSSDVNLKISIEKKISHEFDNYLNEMQNAGKLIIEDDFS